MIKGELIIAQIGLLPVRPLSLTALPVAQPVVPKTRTAPATAAPGRVWPGWELLAPTVLSLSPPFHCPAPRGSRAAPPGITGDVQLTSTQPNHPSPLAVINPGKAPLRLTPFLSFVIESLSVVTNPRRN